MDIGQLVPEKKILRVFTIYGHGGRLGHVTHMPGTNFSSPYPTRLHIKFGFGLAVSEEKMFKIVDARRTTDGRTTDRRLNLGILLAHLG